MSEKILQTRILMKVDTLENWEKSTLPLKKGELAFATVAASVGTGLTEPVVMVKIGEDGVKTFKDLPWNFYAKASDVLAACKSEAALKAFVDNVIANAGIASSEAMTALSGRVTKLEGDESTEGSVAKAIKDAISALDLDNTYVAKEEGKSLVADTEIARLADMKDGANKVEASETNGNIKIDGVETVVYTHPEKHIIDDVTGLQAALDDKVAKDGNKVLSTNDLTNELKDQYDAAYAHSQVVHAPADAQANIIESVKVNGEALTITDKAVDVIVPTKVSDLDNDSAYLVAADIANKADKATTLAGYGIGDAYTKDEVDGEIEGAINTFVSAYITSDGEAIDKLQEIANWIDSDKDGAADIIADVEANAEGIKGLSGRLDVVEDAIETHGDIVTHNVDEFATSAQGAKADTAVQPAALNDYYTKAQADAAFTDSTEVDGQIDAKITTLALGTMSKETATDYVKKTEAVGYDDILTKTEAASAYQAKGDYYTKSEADAEFTNATEVDGQIDAKIGTLDLANTYDAKGAADEALAAAKKYADENDADTTYTVAENGGLKLEGTAFAIDDSITFVFDCGNSGVVAE